MAVPSPRNRRPWRSPSWSQTASTTSDAAEATAGGCCFFVASPIGVVVSGDSATEADEPYTVTIASDTLQIGQATASGMIINDDGVLAPVISASAPATVQSGTTLNVTLSRAGDKRSGDRVRWAIVPQGTAGVAEDDNISCAVVMLLSRFIPIIGPVAIAGILAKKKYIPESAGTLSTDTGTFGIMVFAVIIIFSCPFIFYSIGIGTDCGIF